MLGIVKLILVDETGNGLDGAINGAQATEGQIGGALLFDEIDDHVSVPDFDYGTDYTVAFWVKSSGNAGTGWQYMFSHAGWNAPNSLNIYFGENGAAGYEGTIRTLLRDSDDADANTDTLDVNADLADGNWHHYTLTVASGIGANIYIDGALMASEQSRGGDAFNPATDLFLGGRSDLNPERFFGGDLDDVRIYDRALTDVEVAGLASLSLGLVGHWKLDEGGGATAFDETGNGHDGAINGAQGTEGQIGGALLFDEIDDHVSVPDFEYGTDYTVAFWLKSSGNEGTGWQYMFSHAGWNAPNSLNIYFGENGAAGYEGTIRTLLRDVDDADAHGTGMLDVNADLADGNWHHYTLTVAAGSGANVYIDGVLMASEYSRGGDAFDPATDLTFGGRSDLSSARFFGGALDDVRIYDRALTELEVTGLAAGSP